LLFCFDFFFFFFFVVSLLPDRKSGRRQVRSALLQGLHFCLLPLFRAHLPTTNKRSEMVSIVRVSLQILGGSAVFLGGSFVVFGPRVVLEGLDMAFAKISEGVLGPTRSKELLGMQQPTTDLSSFSDPHVDSEMRMLGVFLCGFGAQMIQVSHADTVHDLIQVRQMLGLLFVGGLARLVSVRLAGKPSPMFLVRNGIELALPAVLLFHLSSHWLEHLLFFFNRTLTSV
jgi:hypothetical protein